MQEHDSGNFFELEAWLHHANKLVILGLGNPILSDDGVGPWISLRLKRLQQKKITVVTAYTTPENFIGVITKADPSHLLIIDAALIVTPSKSAQATGEKRLLSPGAWIFTDPDRFQELALSTHTGSLSVLLAMLQEKNPELAIKLLLVQPASTILHKGLSREVQKTAKDLLTKLSALLDKSLSER